MIECSIRELETGTKYVRFNNAECGHVQFLFSGTEKSCCRRHNCEAKVLNPLNMGPDQRIKYFLNRKL